MTRFMVLISTVSFGLSLCLVNGVEIAQAQTPRMDTIHLMAATQGNDYDFSGFLEWCVSQTWHVGYDGGAANALDELAQWGAGRDNCYSDPPPRTPRTEPVELLAYGQTDNTHTSCTLFSPCESLYVRIGSGSTAGQCNFIEAVFFDITSVDVGHLGGTGEFKGRQRILHATGPSNNGRISVASGAWYQNRMTVGTVVDDHLCRTTHNEIGWTGYHVHQDFMPSTFSEYCQSFWNTSTNFATDSTDWRREDPNVYWIYSLVHTSGLSCFADGPPKVADNLLAPDGELDGDGNGGGTRALATGAQSSLTSPQMCITGTSWCGTVTATPPVVVAAYRYYQGMSPIDYFNSQQKSIPPSESAPHYFWYGPDSQGYYLQVWWIGTYIDPISGYRTDCSPGPAGGPRYWADWTSNSFIVRCGGQDSVSIGGAAGSPAGIDYYWGQFRGAGGVNPSIPPSQLQQDANTWAQTQIDTGHWADVVKPALDAVIRAGRGNMDMATLGITGNPPFDGDLGQVGLAGVMNKMNTLASGIMGPPLVSLTRDEMNRDWISSTSLRWNLTRKALR